MKFKKWYALDTKTVLKELNVSENGLDSEEAKKRLSEYGENKLPEQKQKNPIIKFLLHFHNVLIYILIVAAVITALMDHWIDTWVILAVVLINAIIGFVQEGKAEKALESIRNMLSLKAHVIRDGQRSDIEATELVPGDIVVLESGDKVPADIRLISERNLKVEESALTGESEPVEKKTGAVSEDAVVGDRNCLVFNSTLVTYGGGRGVVVATGKATEIGKISTMMSEVEKITTPLLRQIDRFGKWLSVAIVALTLAFFGIGYTFHDYSIDELFMAVIGLAVAAIPEGLPAIMTITLALGVQRMAARNAIIRKLPSVETLGSVTVICSDKTGTLTKNEMTVRSVLTSSSKYEVSGTGYSPDGDITKDGVEIDTTKEVELKRLVEALKLCNDSEISKDGNERWVLKGDPTEGALVTLGLKAGIDPDDYSRKDTIPFESDHKFMATLHESPDGKRYIFLKGAPEKVLDMCQNIWDSDQEKTLDKEAWLSKIDKIAERGQRVIAAAFKKVDASTSRIDMKDVESDMLFLGLAGMIDPPRPEAISSIAACHDAGIKVKMITGDHAITARAIAKELGIGECSKAITGNELEKMTAKELEEVAVSYDVFARTSPEHKLRLVQALQKQDNVVAMTGDGVNDAPALKRADVGVAMGIKGTEVTKGAADMVLADDNFSSIANAVREGRTIYDNLRKAILFILPTNGAEAFVVMAAILMGIALPITPIQILWVNMVTAVTLALALSFEPAERGVMKRPPRAPDAPILGLYFIWRIVFVSLLIGGLTLMMYNYLKANGYDIDQARTIAVNILVSGQAFYLINCRYMRESAFTEGFFDNRAILVAITVLILFQLVFVYTPFMNTIFNTTPIQLTYWFWVLGAGFTIFLIVELEKYLFRSVAKSEI